MDEVKNDLLFPEIALNGNLGFGVTITFILGLIAAAYSSAQCSYITNNIFLRRFSNFVKKMPNDQKNTRKKIHIGMSLLLIIIVILFKYILDRNVIDGLLTVAGYTYGPLLGLFSFGIFTNYKIKENLLWPVLLLVLLFITILGYLDSSFLGGYELGYELLPLNGLLTFLGLILIRRKQD